MNTDQPAQTKTLTPHDDAQQSMPETGMLAVCPVCHKPIRHSSRVAYTRRGIRYCSQMCAGEAA
jgi:hypothetical protein